MKIKLAEMQAELIPAVISLERECGLSSRDEASYLNLIQGSNSILIAALDEAEQVVAVFSGWVVGDELEIDNVAVSPASRQQGIASKMMTKANEVAIQKGAVRAILEVRANNKPACALYEKLGFEVVGQRKNYYQNPLDDALIMALGIGHKISSYPDNQS